jgi:DNA modification methylase
MKNLSAQFNSTHKKKTKSLKPKQQEAGSISYPSVDETLYVNAPISDRIIKFIEENARQYGIPAGKAASLLMTEILESAMRSGIPDQPESILNGMNERDKLFNYFAGKLYFNACLTRQMVSFQESKKTPFYRWLKYKEAFSPSLIEYLLDFVAKDNQETPHILDPFAGTGTVLTRSASRGWKATGIELLPVGNHALQARFLADSVSVESLNLEMERLRQFQWIKGGYTFPHLKITQAAFPAQTEKDISAFHHFLSTIKDGKVRFLFWFASLSILEDVSFTRKDGQYLRWDHRSGRKLAQHFDKGRIPSFKDALFSRLEEIRTDIASRNGGSFSRNAAIINGSTLYELPRMEAGHFDAIITSPPYCNRYDYTRTYALELAYCGLGEDELKNLRQTLLSATVENKDKRAQLRNFYEEINAGERFSLIEHAFDQQSALNEILMHLDEARRIKELSNNNIPSMVRQYFFEMAAVIFEFERLLKPGGKVFMVNDNVRYHGQEIPVDLILSDFTEKAGLKVEKIWVLPKGKGNSSQQMGKWGRVELRKCIYYWTKPSG